MSIIPFVSTGAFTLLPGRQQHGGPPCGGSQRRPRQSAQIPQEILDYHGSGGQSVG